MTSTTAIDALRTHWGHDAFRPLQAEAIEATLAGHDVLVILPTGGGKSVTFQATPVVARGLTVAISPLLALARDQVQAALERGIEAAMWAGSTGERERSSIRSSALASKGDESGLRLLYTTPESLRTAPMRWVDRTSHVIQNSCLALNGLEVLTSELLVFMHLRYLTGVCERLPSIARLLMHLSGTFFTQRMKRVTLCHLLLMKPIV